MNLSLSGQTHSDHQRLQQLLTSHQKGCGLPRAFYQDTALYEYELEHIWRRGWVFAGYACQVKEPGDYFTLMLDSDALIVMRDDEGQIRAFHNICTHRGTLLCLEETGHARAIVCPYHQWTYSLRGELIACHGMQEEINKSKLGLHPIHVESCEGLIFISLAPEPPPFEPARQLMAPLARPQGFERATIAQTIDYEIHANWKLVWENNRECYHCNVNHPQYIKSNFDIYEDEQISPLIQQRLGDALARSDTQDGPEITHKKGGLAIFPNPESNTWYSANRTILREGYESESLDGRRVAPLMGDYGTSNSGVLRMRCLPNFWNHSSCDYAMSTRLLPGGIHSTRARVTWLVHEDAQPGVDYDLERLLPFWQLTSEQDWELCERVQRGVNSTAYRPGPLSHRREYNLDAFIRWYLRQLVDGL